MIAALASAPAGWFASDHFESQNAFCTSCHLDASRPLHAVKGKDFVATPATSLVAAHHEAKPEFRCIDCHGGASFPNKLRVKTVAARDAIFYLLGRFEEPEDMQHPLWNEDCSKCHATYDPARDDAFHATSVHNLPEFEYECVECHQAHPTGRAQELDFLERESLVAVCRNCHEEF